jgi:hypothetical protein
VGGRNFSAGGPLTNSVLLVVGEGSTLTLNDTLTNTSAVQGAGTIVGDATNSGSFSPGGTLTVTGDYTQESAGELDIDIEGTTAGTYDVLAVSDVATLAGKLKVTLGGGVVIPANTTFDILTCGSRSGQFTTLDLPQTANSTDMFTVVYKSDRVSLVSKCLLTVQSTPITGINIAGTYYGPTNYAVDCPANASVTLTAPQSATNSGRYYMFYRWVRNGSSQTIANRKLVSTITRDTTAVATYKRFSSMKITGPTTVNESSSAKYALTIYWSGGTHSTMTSYATWTDNSSHAKFTSAGVLKTSAVTANKSCRITAAYAGKSCSLYITIRNR